MKIKKTYYDGTSRIVPIEELRNHYLKKGENPDWVDFVISQLGKGNPVSTSFALLEPMR